MIEKLPRRWYQLPLRSDQVYLDKLNELVDAVNAMAEHHHEYDHTLLMRWKPTTQPILEPSNDGPTKIREKKNRDR